MLLTSDVSSGERTIGGREGGLDNDGPEHLHMSGHAGA